MNTTDNQPQPQPRPWSAHSGARLCPECGKLKGTTRIVGVTASLSGPPRIKMRCADCYPQISSVAPNLNPRTPEAP